VHPQRFVHMAALGEEFRSAREARGLTLSDVAGQIHIRSVYLNAIENEDWTSIGAPVYVRGFIRTYARFLGLEGESAIERFNQSAPAAKPAGHSLSAVTAAAERDRESSGPSLWVIAGAIVALVLVCFVGYEWWAYSQGANSGGGPVAAGRAQPTPQPTGSQAAAPANASALPSATPTGPATPASRHQLAVRLTQRSWLRVTVDGTPVIEGIFPAGTVRTFTGNAADVRAGNAGGVMVSVNGRPPVPMGKDGDVTEQRFTL
jgi:cytoskeletal protein RodZ